MKGRVIRATCLILLSLTAVGKVFPENLVVERYNGREPGRSDQAGVRIAIDFFPDGLIRSYEEKYYDKEKGAFATGKSFTIARKYADGAEIMTQVFSQSGQNPSLFVSIRNSDTVVVNFSQAGKADLSLELKPEREAQAATTLYSYSRAGNNVLSFKFTPDENSIETQVSARGRDFRETYSYRIDWRSGLPSIACQTPDNIKYETKLLSQERTMIDVSVINGPLDESFLVLGRPTHSLPAIALMNYEFLWDDSALGNAIFPYLGGSPE